MLGLVVGVFIGMFVMGIVAGGACRAREEQAFRNGVSQTLERIATQNDPKTEFCIKQYCLCKEYRGSDEECGPGCKWLRLF